MAYSVSLGKSARRHLDKLPDDVATMLVRVIHTLAEDPRPVGCKKLKGADAYRGRKGNYRIIYEI